ncbi:hypothetical protein Bca52824_012867 [Brassica carinata]|uniref:Uncharacterized protein n=1 Tax=Brassica carinata TaxID=52824 RepID=A0A8X7VY42_BRACI|nr:hypothetical protein Bca52824_012867 [Brassica carinata]
MTNSIRSSSSLIDPRSGFCNANSTFYSKRNPLPLPANASLDVTTFISSQAHRGTTAFIDAATGHSLTFSDLWTAVNRVTDCLHRDVGVRRGDVVLVLSPNSISIPIVCLSVMSLNPTLAFTTPELAQKLVGSGISVVLERVGPTCGGVRVAGYLSEMMNKEPSGDRVRSRVEQDDTAMLLYSSGTTGRSKGVISSHGNLTAHVARYIAEPWEPSETFLCTVPLFHTFGLLNYVIATVALGSTVVILRKFDLHGMTAAIEKYRATTLVLVPPILVAMINGSDVVKAKYDLSSVRTVRCGGAPLSKEVTEEFLKAYPTVDVFQGYALTESNGAGASVDTVEESRRYGAAGLLSSGVEARIVDLDTGRIMGVNQTGELWLRGPSIARGYLRNEEATKETIHSDGWLKTGDLCYIDSDGFVFIVDRLKELIKYKGYQVPPAELEALLLSHPDILDAAVIPIPDNKAGQCPMAFVQRMPERDLSKKQVIDFISKQVAPYKRIRKVAFIDSVPKTASGKTLRKVGGALTIQPRSIDSTVSKRDPMILPPPNQHLDVATFISSQPHRGKTAFVDADTGRRLGFPELWLGVKRVAARLHSLGVRKGDVVIILSPNSILYPVVSLSVMSLGAVITTANPISTSGEIAKQLEDSLPVLAFTTCQLVSKLATATAAAAATASESNLQVVLMDGVRAHEKGVKIVGSLETMMESEQSESRVKQRVNQDDTAALLYSSGTTGRSKGVMITHRNLIALVHTYRLRFGLEQRTVCTIPMCHVFSFGGFATSLIALGWTTVVLPRFEMAKLLSAVETHRPTHLTLVPPMIVGLVNGAKEINSRYDVSSLHTVVAGGAPLSREVIEKFVASYPKVKVLQGYGLTETTAIVATMFTKEETERFGSSGLLSPNVEAKIVDPETGRLLGVGQTGELWLRSPTVMKGYYKNEEATADTMDSEGWLKTGDLCYIDSEGFVFVVDRLKELIKCNGYQVAPAELEAVLLAHPEIDDAAVIPIPDEKAGQYPMAYIVRKAGSNLSESEIMGFVAKQVSRYKKIRKVTLTTLKPKIARLRHPGMTKSSEVPCREKAKVATSRV